ncbi:MAG: potassium channel protein [Ignavibacteriae bacterium HGW-Ignavibacteriae-1]|jgi:voltage-gated potassium channel|nr:MAG: potassium channel protein [Ignavibacteriae bacterium HGW-Ignavibacteriae-1]
MLREIFRERIRLLTAVERILEGPMILLGFVWLVLLVIELVWGINKTLEYVSLGIWGIFIIDFLIKITLAPEKLSFLKKNWLTAISLFIPALRIFRVFRFVRLLRGIRGIRLVRIVSSFNRSMRSLGKTMKRRALGYVIVITLIVIFAGAAGMYALENPTPGFTNYGLALWWTAMRVITAGNEFHPITTEGRALAFLITIFGYSIFGYVTATFASYFIGRDAQEKDAPIAGSKEVEELKSEIIALRKLIEEQNKG